jgi:hypothetical protein
MSHNNDLIEIMASNCKGSTGSRHSICPGTWEGLGFIVKCTCVCHSKKNQAMDWRETPISTADIPNRISNEAMLEDV